jgi:hypothetical protein
VKKGLLLLLCATAMFAAWFAMDILRDDLVPSLDSPAPDQPVVPRPEASAARSTEEEWFAEIRELTVIRLRINDPSWERARAYHVTMRRHRFFGYPPSSWFLDGCPMPDPGPVIWISDPVIPEPWRKFREIIRVGP